MLIDEFLPQYEVSERHTIDIHAPIEQVYASLRLFDMRDSQIVLWLFRLRGLPLQTLTLDGMLKFGFILLEEMPPQELVFGLIGRFWSRTGGIQRMNSQDFARFEKPGFAKVAANFSLAQQSDGIVRAATETRVHCLDDASRRYFRFYWLLIGPFSGWIRLEWLRLIKQKAESLAISQVG